MAEKESRSLRNFFAAALRCFFFSLSTLPGFGEAEKNPPKPKKAQRRLHPEVTFC
jgi:hypothetical protein